MAAWKGPRHRSWAANGNLATIAIAIIFISYMAWEIVGEAPQGLTSLLGAAGGIWFAAVSGDKSKRDNEARTQESKRVDRVERVIESDHDAPMNELDRGDPDDA